MSDRKQVITCCFECKDCIPHPYNGYICNIKGYVLDEVHVRIPDWCPLEKVCE